MKRTVIIGAVVLFLIYFVYTQPGPAGNMAHSAVVNIFNGLGKFGTFLGHLVNGK